MESYMYFLVKSWKPKGMGTLPWRPEEAAMGNSTLPTVLDKLCMVANINTRKLIEVIKAGIKIKENKIQSLAEMIDSLEDKIKDQDQVLSTLEEKLPKK